MQSRAEKAGVHRMGEVHRGKPKPLRPLKVVEKVRYRSQLATRCSPISARQR